VVSKVLPADSAVPSSVLTPTWLFDMGFPTPSAGGGWLGRAYDPFPAVRNQMMSASPKWEGEFPLPQGLALPAEVSSSRLANRRSLLIQIDNGFAAARTDAGLSTLDA